jgi:hypothetical protein
MPRACARPRATANCGSSGTPPCLRPRAWRRDRPPAGLQASRQHAALDGVRRRRPHRRHDDLHEHRPRTGASRSAAPGTRRRAAQPLNTAVQAAAAGACLRGAGVHRGRVPHAPAQHAEPARHRTPGRAARRHPARAPAQPQRHAARHRRLQHHRGRVADREGAPGLAAREAALTRPFRPPPAPAPLPCQEEDPRRRHPVAHGAPGHAQPVADGAQAVAASPASRWTTTSASSTLWLLSTLGGAPRALTQCGDKDGQPQWSPRGDRIAFTARREQQGRKDESRSST